jgi:hypothetical protein
MMLYDPDRIQDRVKQSLTPDEDPVVDHTIEWKVDMNNPLTDRIASLDCWQGPITCEALSGGITNQNFVVDDGSRRFVARICEDRRFLGIDRANEALCQTAADDAGLAPRVIQFKDEILISVFIDGRTFENSNFQDLAA